MRNILERFNHNSRTLGASRFGYRRESSTPVLLSGAPGAGKRFFKRGSAAVLFAVLFVTPCPADARSKVVTTWAFPAQSRHQPGKPTKAKPPLKVNYQTQTPGRVLGIQNVQAQQAAERGLQLQLRQRQSSEKNGAH
jgi:hypothetical protein